MNTKRVFLAHNPYISRELALRIFHMLQSPELDISLVHADRSFSTSPPSSLYDGWIEHSHVMIVVLVPALYTRNHVNDVWFWHEIEQAIRYHIPIMTVLGYGFSFSDERPPQVADTVQQLSRQNYLQVKGDERLEQELDLLHTTVMSLPLPSAVPFIDPADTAPFEQSLKSKLGGTLLPTNAQLEAERLLNLGLVAVHQGEFATAEAYYDQAIAAFSGYYNAHNSRAVARAFQGNLEGVLSDLGYCIEADSKNFRAYSNRGNVYMRLRRIDDAMLDYSKAIDLNPHSSHQYNNRGFARCQVGDYRGAVDDCTAAIKINPQSVDAYDSRGFAYYGLGDYESALTDFKHVLQIRADNIESLVGLAITYQALGDSEAAKTTWDGFVEAAGTDDIETLNRRYLWAKNIKGAIEALVQSLGNLP